MKKQITIHTEPCDLHTPVIVRRDNYLRSCQYGEFQDGPYFLESELVDALNSFVPYTDTSRIDILESLKFEIQRVAHGWYVINDVGEEVFTETVFTTWREAADAVIDQYNNQ